MPKGSATCGTLSRIHRFDRGGERRAALGVAHGLRLLRDALEAARVLAGCATLADAPPALRRGACTPFAGPR